MYNFFLFLLPPPSLSSTSPHSSAPLLPVVPSLFHSLPLRVTWTSVWPCDGCPAVSLFPPMKRPTICSVVHNTPETAGTYGWEGVRERERVYRPDECLYLPPGAQTGLHFTHLGCQQCKNHQLRSSMWREKYRNKWSIASLKQLFHFL